MTEAPPQTYAEVPIHRKNWMAILLTFCLPVVALIAVLAYEAATGPIFYVTLARFLLAFVPSVGLIAVGYLVATGPIYYLYKGEVRTYSRGARVFLMIVAALLVVRIILRLPWHRINDPRRSQPGEVSR